MCSLTFSFFKNNNSNLEGYVSQFANNYSILDGSVLAGINNNNDRIFWNGVTENERIAGASSVGDDRIFRNGVTENEGFNILINDNIDTVYNKYTDLSNNITTYKTVKREESKYDLVDDSGNMLYKKDMHFKETIPKVKEAVLEDSITVMNYNNYLYTISGIAVAFLVAGVIIIKK